MTGPTSGSAPVPGPRPLPGPQSVSSPVPGPPVPGPGGPGPAQATTAPRPAVPGPAPSAGDVPVGVAQALARLAELEHKAVPEHVEVFDGVHRLLQDALATLDEA